MIRSKKHLLNLLKCSESELNDIIDNIDEFYYEKRDPKLDHNGKQIIKDGEPAFRLLTPSKGILKEIQNNIKNHILKKFDFPTYIQGGVTKRSNITNALIHKGKKYHFVTDIKDFFPSITHKLVYQMFVSQGFSFDVASILTRLTTYKFCLPQGTHTSPYLANLVTIPLDDNLIKFCSENSIIYTRFVDDLSFSSQVNFQHLTTELKNIIKDSFAISEKKTFFKVGPTEITGVIVKNNILKAPPRIKIKLEAPSTSAASKKSLINYDKRIRDIKN